MPLSNRIIRVLVVDDSQSTRDALKAVLESDPGIQVFATAMDPYEAVARMKEEVPDVIMLDVEMPRMDGITFLERIMAQHPIPVVICSSLAEEGSRTALLALEKGAVDIITKPRIGTRLFFQESAVAICDVVKGAAHARLKGRHRAPPAAPAQPDPKLTADAIMPPPTIRTNTGTTEKIVAVGASTGGTEALKVFLMALPPDTPGMVIVQHMPENFTASFAQRLNSLCKISVKEAQEGDPVVQGQALIAPGNRHTLLKRSGASRYLVSVRDGPLVCRHRPSVDVLFRSTAQYAGQNAIGVILTGMGDDGARGMLEMKQSGAYTIAQDEATCVVFGMPNEAIKRGGVHKVLPLDRIAREVITCSTSLKG